MIILLLLFFPAVSLAGGPPQVSGYGVKSCLVYSQTAGAVELGEGEALAPYLRYREWLAGLVTGLSLTTGEDMLQELEFDQAMERITLFCEAHPADDFFTAAMDLLKRLNKRDQ